MKRGLVLGGGGLVGMGYHAGALKALDEFGCDVSGAEIIVGTSAGAIIGSYLASGWGQSDFYEYAHGRHHDAQAHPEEADDTRPLFDPLWESRSERVRRSVGSLFALASSRGFWRGGRIPPSALRRAFPSGMYSTERTRDRLNENLPQEWPRDGLYICAAELYSGARVAFGRDGAPPATLPEAVLAASAIPGFFPPVKVGETYYVDGGVVSATSLDLAADDGCDVILCIAPLGYRNEGAAADPKLWPAMALRQFFARALRKEVNDARSRGVSILVVRPWVTELGKLGTNAMRRFDRTAVVEAARDGTRRLLEEHRSDPVLSAFAAASTERAG